MSQNQIILLLPPSSSLSPLSVGLSPAEAVSKRLHSRHSRHLRSSRPSAAAAALIEWRLPVSALASKCRETKSRTAPRLFPLLPTGGCQRLTACKTLRALRAQIDRALSSLHKSRAKASPRSEQWQ